MSELKPDGSVKDSVLKAAKMLKGLSKPEWYELNVDKELLELPWQGDDPVEIMRDMSNYIWQQVPRRPQ